MSNAKSEEIVRILAEQDQDLAACAASLMPLVYDDLRALAAGYLGREARGVTLQPTDLVHEAFLKLLGQSRVDWKGRTHFFAVGATMMRRILVDLARHRGAAKRGGDRVRIPLEEQLLLVDQTDEDVIVLEELLEKLARLSSRQAKMVELRFYAGMNFAEIAEVLHVSQRTVEREWTMVRAWLRREMRRDAPS